MDLAKPEFGVIMDVEGEGNVLGVKFLSLKSTPNS